MTITDGFIVPLPLANPKIRSTLVPIAPISIWSFGNVSSVIAFPTALDEDRLKNAFAKAASYWPSICGRYVTSNDGGFAFSLTQSPIPFSTQKVDADYPFPNKNVIQPDLASYLPPLDPSYPTANANVPLLTVRLTTLGNGNSVLGVNWGHILGDGSAFNRFLEDVSLFYNLPSADLEAEDLPTLSPHVDIPQSTPEARQKFKSFCTTNMSIADVIKGYTDAAAQSEPVTVILTPQEIAHIVAARLPGERLSTQDMITGWWISVLERAGQHINDVAYSINYRGMHAGHPAFPPSLPTLGANVAQMRQMPIPPPSVAAGTTATEPGNRAATIARAVRAELNRLKDDADYCLEWLSNSADLLGEGGREGTLPCLVPPRGSTMVNSNLRYDWAIKFGQPTANYHTDVSVLRFLRVFQANPREGAEPGDERDAELVFRVEWGKPAEAVQEIIEHDRRIWASEEVKVTQPEEEAAPEPEVKSFGFGQQVHRPAYGGYGN